MSFRFFCGLLVLLFSLRLSAQPLFDSHLHYSVEDVQRFNPQAIIDLLDKNAIHYAAVTGTPPEHIVPNGIICDDWYELFVTYPNRFMIGVNTYSTERWQLLDSAIGTILNCLEQLPDDIAVQLAFINAAKLYSMPTILNDGHHPVS